VAGDSVDLVMSELARQCYSECAERGLLVEHLRCELIRERLEQVQQLNEKELELVTNSSSFSVQLLCCPYCAAVCAAALTVLLLSVLSLLCVLLPLLCCSCCAALTVLR